MHRLLTLRAIVCLSTLTPATLLQAVLADFILEGHFARHIRRMRALYRDRRAALVEAIQKELGAALRPLGDDAGMHLVAALSKGDDRAPSIRAARTGLWAMPLSSCYLERPSQRGFVLGFGGASVHEISRGVRRLRTALGR